VDLGQREDFNYQIQPVAQPMPGFAYITSPESDQYFRLEVFMATGSRGYDVYGYSGEHLIADVLDLYESHLEYLRLADGEPDASVPSPVLTDWHEDFPPLGPGAENVEPPRGRPRDVEAVTSAHRLAGTSPHNPAPTRRITRSSHAFHPVHRRHLAIGPRGRHP
jgi:hypothetical protein